MLLFSGNANPILAQNLAVALDIPLSVAVIESYGDGESKVAIETDVRQQHVVLLQSTSHPANHNLIEMCLLVDAIHRAGARTITLLIPYFGYARMDYAALKPGCAHSAKVVANILNTLPIARIVTCDLHALQIGKYFTCEHHNLSAVELFATEISMRNLNDPIIVAPDIGGAKRAQALATILGLDHGIIFKQRSQKNDIFWQNGHLSVRNRDCIIIDDIIDSGHTLISAQNALQAHGAAQIFAYCTHALLKEDTVDRLLQANFDGICFTDSVSSSTDDDMHPSLKTIPITPLLTDFLKNL